MKLEAMVDKKAEKDVDIRNIVQMMRSVLEVLTKMSLEKHERTYTYPWRKETSQKVFLMSKALVNYVHQRF